MFTSLFTNLLLYLNLICLIIEFKLKFKLNLFVKEMNLNDIFLDQPESVY